MPNVSIVAVPHHRQASVMTRGYRGVVRKMTTQERIQFDQIVAERDALRNKVIELTTGINLAATALAQITTTGDDDAIALALSAH